MNKTSEYLVRFCLVITLLSFWGLIKGYAQAETRPQQDTLYIFESENGSCFAATRAIALANGYDPNCATQTVIRKDPNFHTPFDFPSDNVEGSQYFVRSRQAMAQNPKK